MVKLPSENAVDHESVWESFLEDVKSGKTEIPHPWRESFLDCWSRLVAIGGANLPRPRVSSEDEDSPKPFLLLSWSTGDHYAEIELDESGERSWFAQIYPDDFHGDEGAVDSPWFFDLLKRG